MSLGMMVTKLAHVSTPESDISQKHTLHQRNTAKPTREFSQTFGDFVTSCLATDPKQVSLHNKISILETHIGSIASGDIQTMLSITFMC